MAEQKALREGKRKHRSPAYPGIDLREALAKAEVIRRMEGKNPAPVSAVLEHWGYKPRSGQGKVALSALIKFGLLEDEGSGENRKVRLTPLALKILLDDRPESPERLEAIRTAALMPAIHKELWGKYQGSLPSDANLRYYLRTERGFQDEAADLFIKQFRSTLAFAQLLDSSVSGTDRPNPGPPQGDLQARDNLEHRTAGQGSHELKYTDAGTYALRTLYIPLTGAPWAVMQVPYPMTKENLEEIKAFLTTYERALTGGGESGNT